MSQYIPITKARRLEEFRTLKNQAKEIRLETSRTMQDVQKDYQLHAAHAGQIQYQIRTLQGELARMNRKMRELNVEASELNKVAAAAEAPKAEEQSNG